jgi:hypothetical protein
MTHDDLKKLTNSELKDISDMALLDLATIRDLHPMWRSNSHQMAEAERLHTLLDEIEEIIYLRAIGE